MKPLHRALARFRDDDTGRVTAVVVLLTTACLAFAGLVVDGGFALAAKTTAIGQAQQAARAGAQALDLEAYRRTSHAQLNPRSARAQAQEFLASTGATGTVTVAGNTVTVQVTAHHRPHLLRLAGLFEITVTGHGQARPDQGAFEE